MAAQDATVNVQIDVDMTPAREAIGRLADALEKAAAELRDGVSAEVQQP